MRGLGFRLKTRACSGGPQICGPDADARIPSTAAPHTARRGGATVLGFGGLVQGFRGLGFRV